jgi:hypothetical protein
MNNKLSFKDSDAPKTKTEKLISFWENEDAQHASPKGKDEKPEKAASPSKYRTVLCCSFAKGIKEGSSTERIAARKG